MESGPVFADSSGRRRRVLSYAGLGAAAVLAICLVAVVVAMTGGPQAPFTHWAVQQPQARTGTQQAAGHSSGHGRSGSSAPGSPGQAPGTGVSPGQSAGASPTAGPSATTTATRTASPASSNSPVPTNPAGKTPPGRTKSPNPHKSASVA